MCISGAGDVGNDAARSMATGNVEFVQHFHRNKNAAKGILLRNSTVGLCAFAFVSVGLRETKKMLERKCHYVRDK